MRSSNAFIGRYFTVGAVLISLFSPFYVSNVSADCVSPPAGLVSWWRGETNALDYVGTNHGTVAGNTTYGAGRVGQGFIFDGNGAVVQLGNPASLHLQDLTIETWLRRTSPSVVSFNGGPGNGVIFGYDNGGYGLYLDPSGVPTFSKIGFNEVKPGSAITDTNWHHVAVTKAGSAVVFYVDGVAHPAAAYDPGFTFSGNAYVGGLGSFYTFYGNVDEVSVYSRALATNEVQAIYNTGSAGKCIAVSPPECTPAPAGLVSWWAAEGNAGDRVGNLNGSLYGGTTFAPGKVGQALSFDGVNDSVTNAMTGLTNILDTYTMELWAWPTAGRASTPESTSGVDGHGNQRYAIFPHSGPTGGTVGAGISVGTNGVSVFEAGDTYLPALLVFDAPIIGWTHIAVVYTNRRPSLYVNGVMVRSGLTSVNPSCPSTQFGERGAASANQGYYAGLLDEVSIYNRALATNEIQAIYAAGSAGKCVTVTPLSCTPAPSGLVGWWGGNGSANDMASTNNGSFINPSYGTGKVNQAFNFDGSGNHVRIPAASLLDVGAGNGLTIEAWVNPADLGQHPIVEWALNGDYGVHLWANAQNPGYLYGSLFGTDGQPHVIESTTSVLNTNVYQHVGMTYDKASGIARLFVNGLIIRELAVGTFTPRTGSDLYVGYRPAGSPFGPIPFVGKIDEVSVYNRALSPSELQTIYAAASGGKCAPGITACATPPTGLVSWWRGETNAMDQAGTNNGALAGNTTYGTGRVGQGFVFDGSGDAVLVGNPTSLQLQDFTIETWIKRASTTVASFDFNGGVIFGCGYGGYAFAMQDNGTLFLGRVGIDVVFANSTITDTNLHHVAVTKIGSAVVFYLDGVANAVPAYTTTYTFDSAAGIGARGDNSANSFFGTIDELAVYNRPLSAGEIQGIYSAGTNGKCLSVTPPLITSQPSNQTLTVGETATFNVTASGTAPLSYQWRMNSTNIAGATADSLVLSNVQLGAAGIYSVIVSNLAGAAISSNATLTVNPLLACVAPPSGLVSWWRAEANALDQAGTNNGTLAGNTTYGDGQVNQAFVLDGVTGSVNVPASPGLNVGLGDGFTVESWIKPEDIANAQPLVEWFGGAGPPWGVHFWISEAGSGPGPGCLYVNVMDQGGGEHKFASAAGIVGTNRWQHVAMTYDKATGTARLFYNGAVVAEQFLGSYTPQTSYPLYLGNRPPGAFAGSRFRGLMDEVTIYNRALATNEIQAIYSADSAGKCLPIAPPSCTPAPTGLVSWWRGETSALDQVGTNNGTLVGNTTFGTGRVGQGFVFDGSGDAVSLGNPVSLQLQDFTIETWIKRASTTQASFDAGGGEILGYGGGGYVLGMLDNGTPFLSRVEVDNVMPNTAITDTNLHHLAVTKLGANVVFYVDGVAYGVPAYNTTYNFATPAAIGARGDTLANSFLGTIDEVAVYNRQLSAGEIQAIYNAGGNGKCVAVSSPFITSQPATQTVTVGETATFNVTASGTGPLSYQWRRNSTNIIGATADSLVLTNVQPAAAGVYSVIVYNGVGAVTSSNATLTINALPGCVAPPAGLVAWWRGENNPADQVGGNNGTLVGNATYGAGRVSQAFVFDGSGDGVSLGNPPSLMLQDFTIEAWIKRANTTVASFDFNGGSLFSHGGGGYSFGMQDSGTLFLSRVEVDAVFSSITITDTNLHHLAVTKVGDVVVFYVDGVAYPAPPYNTTFSFATAAAIGARGDNLANSFLGTIDEVSVYSRPLAAPEIQGLYTAGSSGKCLTAIPASIVTQPANKTVLVGGSTTFSVTAGGTPPFSYQWRFNGTSITNATNATLTLANVQASQAGSYSVLVGNAALPPVLSSNATLTVTYPVANVRLFGTNIVSGRPVTLPIRIAANGNENAVSFSLNYTTTRLNFRTVQLGDFPPGTLLFVNTSQTNLGRLGVTVALPSGATFAPGTQLLAGVTFDATISLSFAPTTTPVNFGDSPMVRGLTDVNALTLPATFTGGSVTLSGTDLEGDASPRPGGSRSFTVSDYVQAGRFAAKLDLPAPGGEFQRADAAPRGAAGDGQIKVMDWVQAGRYFAGLDPLTAVGGPTLEVAPTGPLGPDALREVRVTGSNVIQDVTVTLPVSLQAQGNENGVGFTVSFDPAALKFQSAGLGNSAQGANLNLNTNQVASGKLGLVLVLPTGSSFTAGNRELAKISLLPTVVGSYPVTLSDQLVLRGVSDPAAIELPASYVAGTVVVNPHPTLLITHAGTNVALAWPAMAAGFNLQSSTNATVSGGWNDVIDTPQAEGDSLKVTLPLTDQTKYFRLRHP